MPYKIEYLEADGGVIATYFGMLSAEEFAQCSKEKFFRHGKALSIGEILSYRYSISDFPEVIDTGIQQSVLVKNATMTKQLLAMHPNRLFAVVAP